MLCPVTSYQPVSCYSARFWWEIFASGIQVDVVRPSEQEAIPLPYKSLVQDGQHRDSRASEFQRSQAEPMRLSKS